jgi:hypothetical protein
MKRAKKEKFVLGITDPRDDALLLERRLFGERETRPLGIAYREAGGWRWYRAVPAAPTAPPYDEIEDCLPSLYFPDGCESRLVKRRR